MGFNRTSRAGQLATLPCLADPTYQRRLHDAIAGAAYAAAEGLEDDAAVGAAMESASRAEVERRHAEHARFAEHLDVALLTLPLEDVARLTIRGLSGAQLADADNAGRLAAVRARAKDPTGHIETELVRAGLVALDGFDLAPGPNGYPVETLSGPGGIAEWAELRREVAARVRTWSTLGESALSPSGP